MTPRQGKSSLSFPVLINVLNASMICLYTWVAVGHWVPEPHAVHQSLLSFSSSWVSVESRAHEALSILRVALPQINVGSTICSSLHKPPRTFAFCGACHGWSGADGAGGDVLQAQALKVNKGHNCVGRSTSKHALKNALDTLGLTGQNLTQHREPPLSTPTCLWAHDVSAFLLVVMLFVTLVYFSMVVASV